VIKDAIISADGRYRYWLYRQWDHSLPSIAWVMLNPSTADANIDDPTIRRCIDFSQSWGFGALQVYNRFAIRSTDPSILRDLDIEEAFGPQNAQYYPQAGQQSDKIVCAWGNQGGSTIPYLLSCAGGIWHLGLTKSGCPRHPLYLPKTTELVRWV
jgi:hypothetical protein